MNYPKTRADVDLGVIPFSLRPSYVALATAFSGLMGVSPTAAAFNCPDSTNPVVVATNCTEMVIDQSKTAVTINSGVTVSDSAFNNSFAAINVGITNPAVIDTLTNNGTIEAVLSTGGSPSAAMVLNGGSSIIRLVNNGTMQAIGPNSGNVLDVYGSIGTFDNLGTVYTNRHVYPIRLAGSIGTLNNNGTIRSLDESIYLQSGASITTLNNWGTIQSAQTNAIYVSAGASIGTFNNTGLVQHLDCSVAQGVCYAALRNEGTITTLNNFGTLSNGDFSNLGLGIFNSGTITNLVNDQTDLQLRGRLPTNYTVIIYGPANFGRMAVTTPVGATNFRVDAAVSLGVSTYASVLLGVTAANLNATSGTFGGGLYRNTWTLTNPTGSQWDLTVDSQPTTVSTGTSSGNKLANAMVKTVNTGSTAMLSNGQSFSRSAAGLTTTQATQLSQTHAEGYSSNMTITLQQMASISNTVMDRIHAPLSGHGGQSSAYEVDPGRYFWVDGTITNGNVRAYDAMAGFGYRASRLIVGNDLLRDQKNGLGIFFGVGYTAMNEPQQVVQNFNSTNYYAGVYGGRYLPHDWKMSSAIGYVYSATKSERSIPNVGAFTGGNAKNDYSSGGFYGAVKLSRSFIASNNFSLTPFAGASYSQLRMSSSRESGGKDFNYSISSASANSAVTFVGIEFLKPLNQHLKFPLSLTGMYRVGFDWMADKKSSRNITASSDLFGSFEQVGANKGPVTQLAMLGLQGVLAPGVTLRAGVVGTISTHGRELGAGGEIKWQF